MPELSYSDKDGNLLYTFQSEVGILGEFCSCPVEMVSDDGRTLADQACSRMKDKILYTHPVEIQHNIHFLSRMIFLFFFFFLYAATQIWDYPIPEYLFVEFLHCVTNQAEHGAREINNV